MDFLKDIINSKSITLNTDDTLELIQILQSDMTHYLAIAQMQLIKGKDPTFMHKKAELCLKNISYLRSTL